MSGYSYGSIYNYYSDLDELMFETKNSMIYDMVNIMDKIPQKTPYNLDDIKVINRMFADYFMDNPNIYKFFYNYQIKKTGITPIDEMNLNETNMLTYMGFVEKGIIKETDLPIVFKSILYSLYGLLTLYFSSHGLTKDQVHKDLDNIIEYILKER